MPTLIEQLFELNPAIRYVATYLDGVHLSSQRPGLKVPSSAESDKYEELIVNPTLLKLVTQRGNIDCGGAQWVIVRYGNFYELVIPVTKGHISVGIDINSDLMKTTERILTFVKTLD